ncbi:MAG: hypothetical protein JWO33_388, partial [Caulobacteraceae bacterium]|nr:hypothetical protein [Caulobacteraceae bacterium]
RAFFERVSKGAAEAGAETHLLSYKPEADETAPAFPPDWLAPLFPPTRTAFSASKAERVLGWTPRIGLAEAQAQTLAWLIEGGWLPASGDLADQHANRPFAPA